MKIDECRDALADALAHCSIAAQPDTPLGRQGFAVLEMAQAYQKDGVTFFTKGDLVNALAAFWYGTGWLHFGESSGLLICDTSATFCPFTGTSDKLSLQLSEKLREKTLRYNRLLNTARTSVECSGEPATISNDFAGKILVIATLYAKKGAMNLQDGTLEDALACFCYGHGWLDASVTCGYFRIMENHDIFTV
jgi:hypothetical protein